MMLRNFLFILLVTISVVILLDKNMSINAETDISEEYIKAYQSKLDRVIEEKLSPKKQIEIGINMIDVICFDNHVLVLKFSASSLVACTTPQTAQKLVDREWGLQQNTELMDETVADSQCKGTWKISYEKDKPLQSKIIKILRITIRDISESNLWLPIVITDAPNSNLLIELYGSFSENELRRITNSLESIENIVKAKFDTGYCL